MKRERRKRGRFWNIENEILIPFMIVGILVICGFGIISCYNGYSIKMEYEREMAIQTVEQVNRDIDFLSGKLDDRGIWEMCVNYRSPSLVIWDNVGNMVHYSALMLDEDGELLKSSVHNSMGWEIRYYMDKGEFYAELLEEQRYVVVAAIAALLIIVEACVFIAYNISAPIRSMGETCAEIERDKDGYRRYRFKSVDRKDEIGQLARTFQNLLLSMENYTKMAYTSKMAASLAHEIKNPIAGIRSGIQLLKGRVEKDGDKMLCDTMIRETDRVTGLITNLFTLSVERESVKKMFPVRPMMEEIALLYGKSPEAGGVDISCSVEEGLMCFANENEMKQIVHNIVSNSLRALKDRKQREIRITGRGSGNWCILELSDTGAGMSAEELTRVREPFYTKNINGIGLGLSIVEKLVENNGGAMAIESEVGAGTTVTLRFHRGETDETQSTGD